MIPTLASTMFDVRTADEVLSSVARVTWAKYAERRPCECPCESIPTEVDLCGWMSECPNAAADEAGERLDRLSATPSRTDDLLANDDTGPNAPGWRWSVYRLRPGMSLQAHPVTGERIDGPALVALHPDVPASFVPLDCVHARWAGLAADGRIPHPVAPLIAAWQHRPHPVKGNVHTDRRRIVPSRIAMFDAPKGDSRGRLFARPPPKAEQMPVFPTGTHDGEYITPALPLALYELGAPKGASGSGAPLALRLFIEAILAAPLASRGDGPIALTEVPLRFLVDRLYPNRRPKPGAYVPLIERATMQLASRAAAVRWDDGVLRNVVVITSWPEHLDDPVRIIVDLPPGAGDGPQVSDRLHRYGPKRGLHYRTLLNLAYWWHEPGRTTVPTSKRPGAPWVFVDDPSRFRVLSDDELVSLVFPRTARATRRHSVRLAHRVLADLARDGELRIVNDGGCKVLPPHGATGRKRR